MARSAQPDSSIQSRSAKQPSDHSFGMLLQDKLSQEAKMYAVVMEINKLWDAFYLARTHATMRRKRCLWLKQEVACIKAAAKEVKGKKPQVSPMLIPAWTAVS